MPSRTACSTAHTARTQEVCSGTRPSLPALQEPHVTSPRASSAPALTEQRASHCSRAKALQHQRSSSKPAVSSAALLGARWACKQLTAAGGAPSSPGYSPELSTARSVLLLAQGTAGAHLRGEELPAPHLGLWVRQVLGSGLRLPQGLQRGCGSRHRHLYGNSWHAAGTTPSSSSRAAAADGSGTEPPAAPELGQPRPLSPVPSCSARWAAGSARCTNGAGAACGEAQRDPSVFHSL